VFKAAMRVHELEGNWPPMMLANLHPVDREFYRACAAARPKKKEK
jgi:hypothetical protein